MLVNATLLLSIQQLNRPHRLDAQDGWLGPCLASFDNDLVPRRILTDLNSPVNLVTSPVNVAASPLLAPAGPRPAGEITSNRAVGFIWKYRRSDTANAGAAVAVMCFRDA
jgi:hypothetical protein